MGIGVGVFHSKGIFQCYPHPTTTLYPIINCLPDNSGVKTHFKHFKTPVFSVDTKKTLDCLNIVSETTVICKLFMANRNHIFWGEGQLLCSLGVFGRADCKQIFTAPVRTYVMLCPMKADKLTDQIHQWSIGKRGYVSCPS